MQTCISSLNIIHCHIALRKPRVGGDGPVDALLPAAVVAAASAVGFRHWWGFRRGGAGTASSPALPPAAAGKREAVRSDGTRGVQTWEKTKDVYSTFYNMVK